MFRKNAVTGVAPLLAALGLALGVFSAAPARAATLDEARQAEARGTESLRRAQQSGAGADYREALGQLETAQNGYAAEEQKRPGSVTTELENVTAMLFWARKMMPLELSGGAPPTPAAPAAPADPDAAEAAARRLLARADAYAQGHPDATLIITVRYFEVAEKYVGTPAAVEAQRKSLDAYRKLIAAEQARAASAASALPPVVASSRPPTERPKRKPPRASSRPPVATAPPATPPAEGVSAQNVAEFNAALAGLEAATVRFRELTREEPAKPPAGPGKGKGLGQGKGKGKGPGKEKGGEPPDPAAEQAKLRELLAVVRQGSETSARARGLVGELLLAAPDRELVGKLLDAFRNFYGGLDPIVARAAADPAANLAGAKFLAGLVAVRFAAELAPLALHPAAATLEAHLSAAGVQWPKKLLEE